MWKVPENKIFQYLKKLSPNKQAQKFGILFFQKVKAYLEKIP